MMTHDLVQLLTWLMCEQTGWFGIDHDDRHGSAGAAVPGTKCLDETAALV